MKIKNYYLFLFWATATFSQTTLKTNIVTALILIPQVGFETRLNKNFTLQTDITVSPWKSIKNTPLQLLIVIPEIRFYAKESFKGFYIGAHLGGSAFKIQKWEYLNTNYYQEGYNYLIGGTLGIQKKVSHKVFIDFFIGGGNQQAFYKGYDSATNQRVDKAENYNKSGEWLIYRGGIMIGFQL